MQDTRKLRVATLGSGNIGTDLLIKIRRSPLLEATLFVGRNLASARSHPNLNVITYGGPDARLLCAERGTGAGGAWSAGKVAPK